MTPELGSRRSEPYALRIGSRSRPRRDLVSDGPDRDPHVAPTPWRICLDPENRGVASSWPERGLPADAVPAEVPGVWNTTYPGYSGVAWYECRFAPELPRDGTARLVFGGVNYQTDAWLNGAYLGRHEGGYDAFGFRVSHALRDGQNRLTLRIVDPSPRGEIDGLSLRACPTAKESWYGGAGGPWGGVWLERSSRICVQDVRVLADPATGRVRLGIELASDLPAEREIGVRTAIHERSGGVVAEAAAGQLVGPSGASLSLTLTVPQPGWWSPESPETYRWRVSLNAGGDDEGLNDAVGGHFGFRTVELCDGLFHLNGQPRYLKGALLQPTYPRSLLLPPRQLVRADLEAAKQAGLNLLRVHLRPPPGPLLTLADTMGLMLYVEPPLAWIEPSARLLEHGKRELAALVRACANHPSVVLWGVFNENAAATEAVGGALLAELVRLDPTRPIVENSGGAAVGEVGMWAWGGQSRCWSPGWDAPRPLNDLHVYLANPLRSQARQLLTSLGDGPTVNVTPDRPPVNVTPDRPPAEQIESRPTADPVLVSEYGCGALPDFDAALAAFGSETRLADAVLLRELRDSLASGMRQRGLTDEIGDVASLVERTQALQAEGILAQTAALRRNPRVSGLIVTQLADAGWEQMAGLTGLWRHPRPALAALARALQPRLLHVEPANPCSTDSVTVRAWLIEEPGLPALSGPAVLSLDLASGDGQSVAQTRSIPVRLPDPAVAGRLLARMTLPLPAAPGRYVVRARLQTDGWRDEAACTVERLQDAPAADGAGLMLLGRGLRSALPAAQTSVPTGWRGPILADLVSRPSLDGLRTALEAASAGAHLVLAGVDPAWATLLAPLVGPPLPVHGARGNFMGMHHYRRRHPAFAGLGGMGGPSLADGAWAETLPAWAVDELPGGDILAGCFTVPDGGRAFLWRATVQTVAYRRGRITFWQLPLGVRRGGLLGARVLSSLVRWMTDRPQ